MSTTYLESFHVALSENKLFQCVSILLTETSTLTVQKKTRVLEQYHLFTSAYVLYFNSILVFSASNKIF